jgi:hypothetical protein
MSYKSAAMKAFSAYMPVFMAESIAAPGKGKRNEEGERAESLPVENPGGVFCKIGEDNICPGALY